MLALLLGAMEHAFTAQIGERIHAEMGFDLFKLQARSNQLILGIGIDAVEAGMGHRR